MGSEDLEFVESFIAIWLFFSVCIAIWRDSTGPSLAFGLFQGDLGFIGLQSCRTKLFGNFLENIPSCFVYIFGDCFGIWYLVACITSRRSALRYCSGCLTG